MSLIEFLIALAALLPVLLLLVGVFRGGAALVVNAANLGARHNTLTELTSRWDNEAASAWAIFTPPADVHGAPNCTGVTCHEVDFFVRDVAGTAHSWAWTFDPAQLTLQRYTYSDPSTPGATLAASGPAIAGITSFAAHRVKASTLANPALQGYAVQDVAVGLGYPGVEGGNALMVVDVANGAQHVVRELLPSVAPSGFDVVVGTFTPPPRAAGPPPAPNPCALNLGVALPPPPAPPACAGACHGCTQTGPPVEILIGAAPCDGKAGWSRYVALPSFVDRFTYWSPDGNAWEFFSKSDTTNTQGTDDAGGCASWGALTQTTVTYWDGSVTTTGGS